MLETAIAQLRFAASLAFGRPFSLWSLEQLVKSLRDTRREFGAIGAEGAEAVTGPVLDAETQQEMQLRRLRAQAVKAKATAYYARLFAELGLNPAQLRRDEITRIPMTRKESVREQPDAFVRHGSQPALRATTTGTTGTPTSICFSAHELHVYSALQAIHLLLSGEIQADDIVQISTSGRGTLGNLCLAGACAQIGAVITMAGLLDPAETLARLTAQHQIPDKQGQVSVLYTYPSYLGELVEYGLALGHHPADFGLRRIVVGGELVTAGLRARAQELFGPVPFSEGYGMTEIWPFGGKPCDQGHLHFEAAQGLLEIVNPETGEPAAPGEVGALVATPFPPFRETTLLLRYNTEDMAQRLADRLTCNLRHVPATSQLLGKRQLAVNHDQGWTYPRAILEALESVRAVPLPARFGFWAVPGGVAVEVVVREHSRVALLSIGAALKAQGVPLCELYILKQADQLRYPFPLRCDLREGKLHQPDPCSYNGAKGPALTTQPHAFRANAVCSGDKMQWSRPA